MSLLIDELAEKIVELDPLEQEELMIRVAHLNFQHGLEKLSQKYKERLAAKGKLSQSVNEVLAELGQIREEIAVDEYQERLDSI